MFKVVNARDIYVTFRGKGGLLNRSIRVLWQKFVLKVSKLRLNPSKIFANFAKMFKVVNARDICVTFGGKGGLLNRPIRVLWQNFVLKFSKLRLNPSKMGLKTYSWPNFFELAGRIYLRPYLSYAQKES